MNTGASNGAGSEIGGLPYVDEHAIIISASRERTWVALLRVVEVSFSVSGATQFTRALGCEDAQRAGPRPLAEGSTFPGFHVASAEERKRLVLAGRHRFSSYALIFRIEELGGDRTQLRAETRAEFPGARGRVYRALVIGTDGHILVTRGLLAATKRRAERGSA